MASDLEGQISTRQLNDINTSADHEIQPPLDYSKIFIFFAIVCICAAPGTAVILNVESIGVSYSNMVIGLVVFEIPYLLMIFLCLPRNRRFRKHVPPSSKVIAGIYYKSQRKITILLRRVVMASWRWFARAGVLVSWGVAVTVLVPKFRRLMFLGSPLWRWSLLAFTVTAAYFAALYVCICLFKIIQIINMIRREKTNLYIWVGLFPNVSLLLYFGFILAAWVGYFRTECGLKSASFPHPEAFDHVTWICISLFVGSILWLSKTCILLMWSADSIYGRYEPRILMTTVKFFYLGLIAGDFFLSTIITNMELLEEYDLQLASEKFSFQNYIMSKRLDTSYLFQVSQSLTSLAKSVKPLQEEGLPKLLKSLEKTIGSTDIDADICRVDQLVKLLNCRDLDDRYLKSPKLKRRHSHVKRTPDAPADYKNPVDPSPIAYRLNIAKILHCIVREQCPTAAENEITFDDLKRWMMDAHMNCVNMGRTLADASAIVTQLDIFMSFVISVVVVLLWLLISGIATTKVLVTIGTPLLALAFIFGESAKLFFQGIIFCFGTNSFDVGDRCILDDTELEVEKIRILTTTFIKIGTEERRMYPNSVLATKAVVNQGWEPDPSDTVELLLDLSTLPKEWETLEKKIDEFFKDDQQKGYFQSSHEVKMKEIGDKVKVTIHFKHVLNVKEMTHGECLHKKDSQHSLILKNITQLVDPKLLIGRGNNGMPVNSHGLHRYQLGQTSTTSDQSGYGMF